MKKIVTRSQSVRPRYPVERTTATVLLSLKLQLAQLLKNELQQCLGVSILFSVLLIMARIVYTGQLTFIFLVWNLFLAFVPYVLTLWLQNHPAWIKRKWSFTLVFATWLVFIPNSFYIITDLFHLGPFHKVPLWFDLALILSFAWNGLVLGILSVRQMEKIIESHWPQKNELLFIYPIMWLNAFGVYIGRYLRFNSWDVITNPFQLVVDISNILLHPVQYRYAWGMVLCFSAMMTLMYITVKKISKAV